MKKILAIITGICAIGSIIMLCLIVKKNWPTITGQFKAPERIAVSTASGNTGGTASGNTGGNWTTTTAEAANLTEDLEAAKKGASGNSADDAEDSDEYIIRNRNAVLAELDEAAEKHGLSGNDLYSYSVVGGESSQLTKELLDVYFEGIDREPSFDSLEVDLKGNPVGKQRIVAAKKAGLTSRVISDAISFPFKSDKDDDEGIWHEIVLEGARNPVWLYQAVDGLLNLELYDGKIAIKEIPGNENLVAYVEKYQTAMEPDGTGIETFLEKIDGQWRLKSAYRQTAGEFLLLLQRFGYIGVQKKQTKLNYSLPPAASLIKVLPERVTDPNRQVNQLSCVFVAIDKDGRSISEEFGYDYLDKRHEHYGAAAQKVVKKITTSKTPTSKVATSAPVEIGRAHV